MKFIFLDNFSNKMESYVTFISYCRSTKILIVEIDNVEFEYNIYENVEIDEVSNLTFKKNYNNHVMNLPKIFRNILFNNEFNKSINNLNGVTSIITGRHFNHTIDNLSNSLIILKLGFYFNQKIDNLPNSLINLTLNDNFDQELKHLPNSLQHLELGKSFNKSINYLPNSIKFVKLPSNNINICHDGQINLVVSEEMELFMECDTSVLNYIYNEIFDKNVNKNNIQRSINNKSGINYTIHYLKNNTIEINVGRRFYWNYRSVLIQKTLRCLKKKLIH